MRTSIVRIGNSQGIRIPKIIIEQCHLGPDVELEVEDEKLIIRSASFPRAKVGEKNSSAWRQREMIVSSTVDLLANPHGMRKNGNVSPAL